MSRFIPPEDLKHRALEEVLASLKRLCDAKGFTFVLRYEYGKFAIDVTPCEYRFMVREDGVELLCDVINYLESKQ